MSKKVRRRDRKSEWRDRQTLIALRLSGILRDPIKTGYPEVVGGGRGKKAHPLPFPLPTWGRSSPLLKATYATLTLCRSEAALKVDVNLGPERRKRAHRHRSGLITNVRRDLSYRLKAHLGRPVAFWFVFENLTDKGKREHLHGVVAASDSERPLVRKALQEVAGDFFPARAVRTQRLKDIYRPASYATKHLDVTRLALRGSPLTMPRPVSQEARALYEAHRAEYAALMEKSASR